MSFTFYKTIVNRVMVNSGHELAPIEYFQDTTDLKEYLRIYASVAQVTTMTKQQLLRYTIQDEELIGKMVYVCMPMTPGIPGLITDVCSNGLYEIYLPDLDIFVKKELTIKGRSYDKANLAIRDENNTESYLNLIKTYNQNSNFVKEEHVNGPTFNYTPEELPQDFTYKAKETKPVTLMVHNPTPMERTVLQTIKSFILKLVG